MPFLQRHAEAVVRAPGIAHGREPLHETFFCSFHRPRRDVGRRVVAVLVGDVLGHRADVHVGVGEPGHERLALEVQRGHAAGQRADLALGRDLLDPIVLDHDRGALDRVGAGAVDQKRVGEDGDGHGRDLRYFATILASYIQTFSSARGVHSMVCVTP